MSNQHPTATIRLQEGDKSSLPGRLNAMFSTDMADNWKPYLCNVNERLASIAVNLGLRESLPDRGRPWLLWVWVNFQNPRPDGLSDRSEGATLGEIEDALIRALAHSCNAIFCGRITTQGRREFYFYGEGPKHFSEAVGAALRNFPGYTFEMGDQEDSSWTQYLNVLYPSPDDLQKIKNGDVLQVLQKEGDTLTSPREVQHWLYFSSEAARTLFKREAAEKFGFIMGAESSVAGDLPFGICVSRVQPVTKSEIDATTLVLLRLGERFQGEYDGWETQVVKAEN